MISSRSDGSCLQLKASICTFLCFHVIRVICQLRLGDTDNRTSCCVSPARVRTGLHQQVGPWAGGSLATFESSGRSDYTQHGFTLLAALARPSSRRGPNGVWRGSRPAPLMTSRLPSVSSCRLAPIFSQVLTWVSSRRDSACLGSSVVWISRPGTGRRKINPAQPSPD